LIESSKFRAILAIRCVESVAETVKGKAEIMIEGHGRFDLPTALRIGKALEPYNILWFEEPIIPDTIEALADLRRRINVPLSFGERLYGRWAFRTLFESRACDYVQPDVSHAGGITELRNIAVLADTHHIPFCPHNPSGPVANAATLQLAASQPSFFLLETMAADVPWRSEICNENIEFTEGKMKIPDQPEISIEIDETEIAKHPFQPVALRHYKGTLTEIQLENTQPFFSIKY
jgi:galactonate dehydratase